MLLRVKLGALLDAGVRTFINLAESHELKPYDALLAEEAEAHGVGASHVRLPFVTTPCRARPT